MEEQLETAKKLFAPTTKVVYMQPSSIPHIPEIGEIVLESYKLDTCPDVEKLLGAIAKKCGRVAVMKQQQYSGALCIALLASKGYCITSLELNNVPDTTIEVCWESLQNIYVTVDEPLKSWLDGVIGKRSYLAYGYQFCQHRFLSSTLDPLGSKIAGGSSFKLVPAEESFMPRITWHRDDAAYSAISSHFRHEARDVSNHP